MCLFTVCDHCVCLFTVCDHCVCVCVFVRSLCVCVCPFVRSLCVCVCVCAFTLCVRACVFVRSICVCVCHSLSRRVLAVRVRGSVLAPEPPSSRGSRRGRASVDRSPRSSSALIMVRSCMLKLRSLSERTPWP